MSLKENKETLNAFHNYKACGKKHNNKSAMITCSLSIMLVLSTFGTDQPHFESSQISSLAPATYKLLHTYETLRDATQPVYSPKNSRFNPLD
jgi:hypothetical protein